MRISRRTLAAAAVASTAATFAWFAAVPTPASAGIIPPGACKALGLISSLGGKACDALRNPGALLKTGKSLLTGHVGSAIKDFFGSAGASSASTALGLAAIVAWVYGGARTALHEMGKFVNETAAPQLGSVWFSSTYWRMAAVAALLTLPFLFAAAVQALVRADISLLARAAFGHLPLALVAVGIAAPVTMLLLSGTDELCALVWSPASSNGLTSVLIGGGGVAGMVAVIGAPFLAFLLCVFTAGAALLVWLELAMREAAVYIVVLLLPLVFAALVWPARRVWAVRAVETLVALILAKFAIVAVLGLGGAALAHAGAHGLSGMLAGMVLVLLAALAPWAVLRLVPLAELASSTAGALRPHAVSSLHAAWPNRGRREIVEKAIAGVAGHVADLAGFSTNGASVSSPGLAVADRHSRNGEVKFARRTGNSNGVARDVAAAGDSEESGQRDASGRMEFGDHADASATADPSVGSPRITHPAADDAVITDPAADDAVIAGPASAAPGIARVNADASATAERSADSARGTGRAGPVAGADAGSAGGEDRIPGADPMWQAPDMSWRPLPLGLEDDWPPELWPPESDPAPPDVPGDRAVGDSRFGAARPDGGTPASASTGIGSGSDSGGAEGPGEQPDPLPPEQDRGGAL